MTEMARPGANWTKIPPENVKKLKGIIDHYRGMAHPFTVCVADQVKHGLSDDHAKRRCAVVKDLALKTTKWRKGGDGKVAAGLERELDAALARVGVVEQELGVGMSVALVEGLAVPGLEGLSEALWADFGLLALAGHPIAEMLMEWSWSAALHPHGAKGRWATTNRGKSAPVARPSAPGRADGQPKIGPFPAVKAPKGVKKKAGKTLSEDELKKGVGKGAWTPKANAAAQALIAGKAKDTESIHRLHGHRAKGKGPYSPERIALHHAIIRKLFEGAGSHSDAHAHFMAGGPASGKSSILDSLHVPQDAVLLNPDVVREMLPEYHKLLAAGDPAASAKTHEEASHITKLAFELARQRRHHILMDTVGDSGPGKFAGKIRKAQAAGYTAHVHYATVPTAVAAARAKKRAERTGRHVPDEFLRQAHADVSKVFVEDVKDIPGLHITIHDNSGKRPKLIASQTPPGKRLLKHHPDPYNRFIAKRNEGQ